MPQPSPLLSGLHSRGNLPHLKREGGTYFVTFRQAGTLPKDLLIRFKLEREQIIRKGQAANSPLTWSEEQALFRWYSDRIDAYLDGSHGTCHLRQPECAAIVAGALKHFDGQRYNLRAWVVMPNHVHAVVQPDSSFTLSSILHTWKSYTAHQLREHLQEKAPHFWQRESYDHLIRNEEDLHRCIHYTVMNPVKAKLCSEVHQWPWSSAYVA